MPGDIALALASSWAVEFMSWRIIFRQARRSARRHLRRTLISSIAVAFGVPCIVLMGPTSLEKTNLNIEGVRVFETDVDCRPCYQRSCPIDHRCMTRLEPESVARAALELLGRRAECGR